MQPRSNIYQLFDNLLLLSHGEMVYYGSVREACEYFTELGHECPNDYNPADYLIDLVTMNSKTEVQQLAQNYRASKIFADIEHTIHEHTLKHNSINNNSHHTNGKDNHSSNGNHSNGGAHAGRKRAGSIRYVGSGTHLRDQYASTWWEQCYVLSHRTFVNNLRNPYLIRTQYALTVLLALLIGGIYWHVSNDIAGVQDRAGVMFFLIALLAFASMSSIDTCK